MNRYVFLRFPKGKPKAVTLSYDDGVAYDIKFSDIISEYGLKATFNLTSEKFKKSTNICDKDIKKYMLDRGHEIAVHGDMHRASGLVRPIDGIKDILYCRLELEKKFGIIIRGMAYAESGIRSWANSANYESIRNYLKNLDIAYARTLGDDNSSFMLPDDWYNWMPTAHHKNPNLMEYVEEFTNLDLSGNGFCSAGAPRLFYLWGHSVEFENDNNWNILNNFCEKISHKDDTWYATNMEIYEYVTAYNSLNYSADGNLVYNPTVLDIWLDADGRLYKIPSGETVNIKQK